MTIARENLERILVQIIGGLLAAAGVLYCLLPVRLFALGGEVLSVPSAVTDVRATYGGIQIALGILVLSYARSSQGLKPARALLVLVLGSVGSLRLLGAAVDGGEQSVNAVAAVVEILSAILVWNVVGRGGAQPR
ncbi:DUF4345 domain-containing protein [Sinimarinibacterium sp. CAU 1509]|uniref:DUF4345 family protein n=1 Tax=Sinimarinibacterium sp. CAU 1509 TaxID=2562283 RepID=UPI0010ACE95E|nr:DUF4345 family protein [Sinimarinibacterium sp. CAU 1509]TJY58402.1 DUF4345 domain-containing protein [Sinimarinibacterium sp. CAU 1509]